MHVNPYRYDRCRGSRLSLPDWTIYNGVDFGKGILDTVFVTF